ncbi:OmpA family protein [Methylomarinum sp. Ch1-1]|uniref:OmpA family protein n=1 Tax=Methylomarinum roseum TaxID=3067653 RepID=A0AAU7NWX6_9GAMM|nr:OmpA family protein [Methylomarinum sp. Ch1-1]MDP4522459.1 OmpA family protein [Methylomarinum sp. Ch1-1]
MKKIAGILLGSTLLAGCAIDPYTGEQKVANTGWGAGAGAAVGAASGALIGGDTEGALIGAAAGAALGSGIGYYMDRQEAKLRARLEGTGVRVQRQGDNLKLIMPGNVTFATDSSNVSPGFYPVLDSVAIVLKEFDETTINISGYTDSTGSDMYNQELSERRANSVASYLVRSGVHHGRIQARGFGERYPVASNDSEAGRSQNRRVEISIRPK